MEVENTFTNITNFIKRKWRSVTKSEVDPTPASNIPSSEVDSTAVTAAPTIEAVPNVAAKGVDPKEEILCNLSTEPEIAEAVPTLASAAPSIELEVGSTASSEVEAVPEVTEKAVDSKEQVFDTLSTEPEIAEAATNAVETVDDVDVIVANEEPTILVEKVEKEEEKKMDSIKSKVESTPFPAAPAMAEDSTASSDVTTVEAVPAMAEEVDSKEDVLGAPSTEPEITEASQTTIDAVDDVDVLVTNEEPTILLEKEEKEKRTEL